MKHQLHRDSAKYRAVLAVIMASFIYSAVASLDYPAAKITSPINGTSVPTNSQVFGNISGELPSGYHMWLVVNPSDSKELWWPLGGGEIVPQSSDWSQSAVIGRECGSGGEQDAGRENVIAIILVDENDHQYLNNWVKKSNIVQNWDGIALPPSTIIVDLVTVLRENDC